MIIRSKAPFRISFGGGGTDVPPYCWEHGGEVVSTTIDKYAHSTLKSGNKKIKVNSIDFNLEKSFNIEHLEYDGGKLDLVKAVINQFDVENGFDLIIHSDMPAGSGMGTSSSVAVSLIGCLKEFMEKKMSPDEIASLAYHAEREDLGEKGGYQDQYAAAFGGLNHIKFFERETTVTPLDISPDLVNELQYRLLLFYTGKTRLSSEIHEDMAKKYEKKHESSVERMEALKKVAKKMKQALSKGNLTEFGELLHEGWLLKKGLSDKIANPQIDKLYEIARGEGALGGKILGAGGGGHLLLFCRDESKFDVIRKLNKYKVELVPFRFESNGLQTWRVKE